MKFNYPKDWNKDELLDLLGLAPKRSLFELILPAIGLFGAGLAVGAGLGLVLAPQSGPELRHDLVQRYRKRAADLSDGLQAHPM